MPSRRTMIACLLRRFQGKVAVYANFSYPNGIVVRKIAADRFRGLAFSSRRLPLQWSFNRRDCLPES